jgi:hypothetical protein
VANRKPAVPQTTRANQEATGRSSVILAVLFVDSQRTFASPACSMKRSADDDSGVVLVGAHDRPRTRAIARLLERDELRPGPARYGTYVDAAAERYFGICIVQRLALSL